MVLRRLHSRGYYPFTKGKMTEWTGFYRGIKLLEHAMNGGKGLTQNSAAN